MAQDKYGNNILKGGYLRGAKLPNRQSSIPGTSVNDQGVYNVDYGYAVGHGIRKTLENPFNVPQDSQGNYKTIGGRGASKLNPKYKGK